MTLELLAKKLIDKRWLSRGKSAFYIPENKSLKKYIKFWVIIMEDVGTS